MKGIPRVATLLLCILVLASCGPSSDSSPLPATDVQPAPRISTLDSPGTLTDDELAAKSPYDFSGTPYADRQPPEPPKPITADKAADVRLEFLSEAGYLDEQKRYVVDLLERDLAYMSVQVQTLDGRPVIGARPTLEIVGSSKLTAVDAGEATDDSGMMSFGIVGGRMGVDRVTASWRDQRLEMRVNVISLKAAGYPGLDEVSGALRWETLMQARLRFTEDRVQAEFPPDIASQNGKSVKLVGFMMPLDPEERQKHFLLTSNPPSCFFHIPGGPAGAVEVFAPKGIVASWDPIILEGRFETVTRNEDIGVIYRIRDARQVKP